jgi:hypothetical protein
MKLDKHSIERIEGLPDLNALSNFKESVNTIIVDMRNEGWEYEDAKDFMFDVIEANIEAHQRQDEEDEEFGNEKAALARLYTLGKKVVIIDETRTENNVFIKTISDFEIEGMIWFEEDNINGTCFAYESDIELFLQGKKAFIHPDEVSIQFIS